METIDTKIQKLWGWKRTIDESLFHWTDFLHIDSGGYCSRHLHNDHFNSFLVLTGVLCVAVWNDRRKSTPEIKCVHEGELLRVDPGHVHQFVNATSVDVRAIEMCYPYRLQPGNRDDIFRSTQGGVLASLHHWQKELMLA